MRCGRVLVLIAGFLVSAAAGGGLSAGPALAQAAGGEAKAIALSPNVVKITATLGQGAVPQTGFGFIVGQQGNQLVAITADHVVRGDDPGAEDTAPLITFFESQGSQIKGKLETVRLPKERGDLAVILVPKPGFVSFVTEAIDTTPAARGLPVWLVGRAGEWDIPAAPGVVAKIDWYNQIQVEGLAARVGSSGGPLVSSNGIIGMIVRDNDLYTEVTPIEPIRRQVSENWHYAWQLAPVRVPGQPTADAVERERQRAETEKQQQREEQAEREHRAYSAARGNPSALRTYVTTCKVCAFESAARTEITTLEERDRGQLAMAVPTPPPTNCGGNSDSQVIRPISLLYQAVNQRNIDLYAEQWADDATYRDVFAGITRTKQEKIKGKQDNFSQWETVNLTMDKKPEIVHKTNAGAQIQVIYSMTFKYPGKKSLTRTGVIERYDVVCDASGRWLIKTNIDEINVSGLPR